MTFRRWLGYLFGRPRPFEPSAEQRMAEDELRRQAEVVGMLEDKIRVYEQVIGIRRGRSDENRRSA